MDIGYLPYGTTQSSVKRYLKPLLKSLNDGPYLEIGCGSGYKLLHILPELPLYQLAFGIDPNRLNLDLLGETQSSRATSTVRIMWR